MNSFRPDLVRIKSGVSIKFSNLLIEFPCTWNFLQEKNFVQIVVVDFLKHRCLNNHPNKTYKVSKYAQVCIKLMFFWTIRINIRVTAGLSISGNYNDYLEWSLIRQSRTRSGNPSQPAAPGEGPRPSTGNPDPAWLPPDEWQLGSSGA